MVWIYVALGVGLIGLVLIGWYLVRLYRKLGAIFDELAVLTDQAAQALDLVAQIELPDDLDRRYDATFGDLDDEAGSGVDHGFTAHARVEAGARPARRT